MKKGISRVIIALSMVFVFALSSLSFDVTAYSAALSEKDKISILLSNFAETNTATFTAKTLTDTAMVDFAVMHNYLNYPSKFKTVGQNKYITKKEVAKVILKYFNKTPKKYTSKYYKLSGSNFIVPIGDGESYAMAKVDKITKLTANTYRVEATTYKGVTSFFTAKDIVKSIEQLKAQYGDDWLGAQAKVVAKVKKLKDRYVVLEYKETPIAK